MLDVADRLRIAAAENLAVELRHFHQLLRHLPKGFEPLQAEGERGGEVFGALAFDRIEFGQQQSRFQIGEPRRHHQIVGRELEPQLLGLLDEGEILLGERQHRDLGEIDLLGAGQGEQQVERPLEAADIDDERLLGGRAEVELGAVREM